MPHQNENYYPPSGPPPSHSYSPPTGPPPQYTAPPGPPPSHSQYVAPPGPPPSHSEYAAPPGPPPSHSEYTPPSGPPPSHSGYTPPSGPPGYAPPPGPPPSHSEYAPPPGPPPSHHDWQTAVPDTSLLPPPPSLGNLQSRTNNATEQEAEQAEAWCEQNPLTGPTSLPAAALAALEKGEIGVIRPRSYAGELDNQRPGIWEGKTKSNCTDSCITSAIPLYSVLAHSPLNTGKAKTIYYEVRIARRNAGEVNLSMGFTAHPYPTFRLPGWHRACLGIHGDDGSKFINDRWGGKDFTEPFKPGETLGLGMTLMQRNTNAPPGYEELQARTEAMTPIDVEIFFTREGRKTGGWNLHEEGDATEDLPVTGLEGFNDLYAAVGVFEKVEFEIILKPGDWMYHPY